MSNSDKMSGESADLGGVESKPSLWTEKISPNTLGDQHEVYTKALIEQYKVYVASADKTSERRMLANTFFLTLNTGVGAGIGYLLIKSRDQTSIQIGALACLAAFSVSLIWILLLRSYRDLNSAKFKVIGEMETRLPSSPFWSAEWRHLGEGEDRAKYWPLSHLEMAIPWIVATFYLALGALTFNLLLSAQSTTIDPGIQPATSDRQEPLSSGAPVTAPAQ